MIRPESSDSALVSARVLTITNINVSIVYEIKFNILFATLKSFLYSIIKIRHNFFKDFFFKAI